MSPSNTINIPDDELNAAKDAMGVKRRLVRNANKVPGGYNVGGVMRKWASYDQGAPTSAEKKIFEDFFARERSDRAYMNGQKNVSVSRASSVEFLFPRRKVFEPAKYTDLYPGQWNLLNKMPAKMGIRPVERQLEFGFTQNFNDDIKRQYVTGVRRAHREAFKNKLRFEIEQNKAGFFDRKPFQVVGSANRPGYEDITTIPKPLSIHRQRKLVANTIVGTKGGLAIDPWFGGEDASIEAYRFAKKRVIRDIIREEFSGDFLKDTATNVTPKQFDKIIKARAKFSGTTISPGMNPDEVTLKHLFKIKKYIKSKGLYLPGSQNKLFSKMGKLDKWGRRQKFYEIKAKLFGGTYMPAKGASQYFENSLFEFAEGKMPNKGGIETLIDEYLEKSGKIYGQSGITATEIGEKAKAEYSRHIGDDIFELRKTELETVEEFSRSFSRNKDRAASAKKIYGARKRVYQKFLADLEPGQRHALEQFYLTRGSFAPGAGLTQGMGSAYAAGASSVDAAAINAMRAANPGMTAKEINTAISKLSSFDRGSVITSVLSEDVPHGFEQITTRVSSVGSIHEQSLLNQGVPKSTIARRTPTTAGLMAMEDIRYGTARSQGGLIDSIAIARRHLGQNMKGGITASQLEEIDFFLKQHPELNVTTHRGHVPGGMNPAVLEGRKQQIENIASQAGMKLKPGQIEGIAPKTTPYTLKELAAMRGSEVAATLKLGHYTRPGISSQLRRINEKYKTEGSLRNLMAFDTETTGYGSGRQFGGGKDYLTQIGWSKSGEPAKQVLVNEFGSGKISPAMYERYYMRAQGGKQIGAYSLTGIHLKDVQATGVAPREAAQRFLRAGKFGTPEASILLGANSEKFDIPKFMRNILPKKAYGLQSLDVTQMAREILPRKNMRLFSEHGFTSMYNLGNIAMNMGIMPEGGAIGLHTAKVDAALTRRVYENLEGVIRAQVDNGNMHLAHYLPENALKEQTSSYIAGQRYMKKLSDVGISYGKGGGEFSIGRNNFVIPKKEAGGFPELGKFLKEGTVPGADGSSSFVRSAGKNYVVRRSALRGGMSPAVAFATQFKKEFNPYGLGGRELRSPYRGLSWESMANFTKKNWRGVALTAAAITVGATLLSSWRSKKTSPMERSPKDQGDLSLFGGTGMNVMTPPTMEGESPYDEAKNSIPISYAARIMDPASVATNVRIRGGIGEDIDYNALGRAMGIVGGSTTGAGMANVNMRVSDNSTKYSDGDIRRKIARMA